MSAIRTLLVANRGEIACRIMRTSARMGIATVAVYSDADAGAPHVRIADKAVRIGLAPASQSYLDIGAILEAARKAGADAVHPGYGFLSENAAFAQAVRDAGLVFVGPSPDAIRAMGDKRAARRIAAEAGLPVIPGYDGDDQSDEMLSARAQAIGAPLMIKAAAGGGGRGMRIVRDLATFGELLASARREAKSAFGDDTVLLEKLVENGKHIEVQVFGDRHGNCVHLFERDCTAQRRHQKIIEEAPSPSVSEALRQRLGSWAVSLAKSVGYEGAGTVEFMLGDGDDVHFLEMNTRLQVEHPVTEMVTGLDLVEWQLRVAAGEKLPLTQDRITLTGHAIEARLCAEDPDNGFAPQTGIVLAFDPATARGEGMRIDAGIESGSVITPYYDPMVAKLIAHGRDRSEAIACLTRLNGAVPLVGVANNGGFLARLVGSEAFASASLTTATIDGWQDDGGQMIRKPPAKVRDFALAAMALTLCAGGNWFRSSGHGEAYVDLVHEGREKSVRLQFRRGELRSADVTGEVFTFDGAGWCDGELEMRRDGVSERYRIAVHDRSAFLLRGGDCWRFDQPDLLAGGGAASNPRNVAAPGAGTLTRVLVEKGQFVKASEIIAFVEAMKMETPLRAAVSGTVAAIHIAQGAQVEAGKLLFEIDAEEQS